MLGTQQVLVGFFLISLPGVASITAGLWLLHVLSQLDERLSKVLFARQLRLIALIDAGLALALNAAYWYTAVYDRDGDGTVWYDDFGTVYYMISCSLVALFGLSILMDTFVGLGFVWLLFNQTRISKSFQRVQRYLLCLGVLAVQGIWVIEHFWLNADSEGNQRSHMWELLPFLCWFVPNTISCFVIYTCIYCKTCGKSGVTHSLIRRMVGVYTIRIIWTHGVSMCLEVLFLRLPAGFGGIPRNLALVPFAFNGLFDYICYANSVRLVINRPRPSIFGRRPLVDNDQIMHQDSSGELMEALGLRLELLARAAEVSSSATEEQAGRSFDSMAPAHNPHRYIESESGSMTPVSMIMPASAISLQQPDDDDSKGINSEDAKLYKVPLMKFVQRKAVSTEVEQERAWELQQQIDDMWLEELRINHAAEIFGVVRHSITRLELGNPFEDVEARAMREISEVKGMIEDSVRVRFDARDQISLEGGLDTLQQSISVHHESTVAKAVPLLKQLSDPAVVQTIRSEVDKALEEQKVELGNIFQSKEDQTEQFFQADGNLAKWRMEELEFARVAVESAKGAANEDGLLQSWTLAQVACKAMLKAAKLSQIPAEDVDTWTKFILKVMRHPKPEFKNNSNLHKKTLKAFARLTSMQDHDQWTEALPLIVMVMTTFQCCHVIQAAAMKTFQGMLSKCPETAVALAASHGVIDKTRLAMRIHHAEATVQERGKSLLALLDDAVVAPLVADPAAATLEMEHFH